MKSYLNLLLNLFFYKKQLGDEISKLVLGKEKVENGTETAMKTALAEETVSMREEREREQVKEVGMEKKTDNVKDTIHTIHIVSQQEIIEIDIDTETENENENENANDTEEERSFTFHNEYVTSIDQNDENGNNDESIFLSGKLPILFNLPILTSSTEYSSGDNIPTEHSLNLLEHSFTSTGTADTAVILDTSSENGFLSNIVKKQNFDSSMSPTQNRNNDETENENENSNGKNKFESLESGSRVRGSLLPKGVTFSFTSSMCSSSADNVLCSPPTGNVPRDLKRDREHSSSISSSSSSSSSFLSHTVPSVKSSTVFVHHSLFCESPSRPTGWGGNGRESIGSSSFTPSSSSVTPKRTEFSSILAPSGLFFYL